jgi:hypothetical protein
MRFADFMAPLEVIQCLVKQWPESVKHMNHDEDTPLDIATSSNAAIEIINWLNLP